jgi:hypothetical protein
METVKGLLIVTGAILWCMGLIAALMYLYEKATGRLK